MVRSGSKGSDSSVSGLFESSRGGRRSKSYRDCPNSLVGSDWFRLVQISQIDQMVQIIRFRSELEEPEELDGLEKQEGFVSL